MRITKIIIKNYRQLKNVTIDFNKKSDNDLHIIIGENGTGKTNTFNAINWCLYYEEPHLNDKSKALPLPNLDIIEEHNENDEINVSVEIHVDVDDGTNIRFSRSNIYRVLKNGQDPFLLDTDFYVAVTNVDGNTKIFKNDEADDYVSRFVPIGIREYFFFDGERLDKYFKSATSKKIKDSIFEISQVQLLETIERKLDKSITDIRKEATRNSPNSKLNDEYELAEATVKNLEQEIKECKEQIELSTSIINECEEFLRGLPDIEEEENKRKQLFVDQDRKNKLLQSKIQEQQDILREYTVLINLYPQISELICIIEEMKTQNQLPPNISKSLLESIKSQDKCIICGNNINDDAINHINSILKKINLSSELSNILLNIEHHLNAYKNKVKNYKTKIQSISRDISELNQDLQKIQANIDNIDKKLGGYKDKDEIINKSLERTKHEKLKKENSINLGSLFKRLEDAKKDFAKKEQELNVATKKLGVHNKLLAEKEFCEQAKITTITTKNAIMDENRKKIQDLTRDTFLNLLWKKDTFGSISISDDYSVSLIHKNGYECLGSCSAAEKALLALSFTLSLHKVSGFLSPLIIDTPISRVSGANRENFSKVLANVSKDKQIVLLFTESEYSEEIAVTFDSLLSRKYILYPEKETETKLKEVK